MKVGVAAAIAVLGLGISPAALGSEPFEPAGHAADRGKPLLAGRSGDEAFDARLQVLLSSIDMTVGLIDAYGQCRDRGKTHDECMAALRATLDHAKQLIEP
jgi:hypothetical protein